MAVAWQPVASLASRTAMGVGGMKRAETVRHEEEVSWTGGRQHLLVGQHAGNVGIKGIHMGLQGERAAAPT